MRIALALALVSIICAAAHAANVDLSATTCPVGADAKALQGENRSRFEAACKAPLRGRRAAVLRPIRSSSPNLSPPERYQYSAHCVYSAPDAFLGACIPCVVALGLLQDSLDCRWR
jgi:hypothetical protein